MQDQDPTALYWKVFKEPYYWKKHNLFVLAEAFDEQGERYRIVKEEPPTERLLDTYVSPKPSLSTLKKLKIN